VSFVAGLAKNEAVAFGDRIGGEDDGGVGSGECGVGSIKKLATHGSRFAIGEICDEPGWSLVAANAAFDIVVWRDNDKIVTSLDQ
jgi:hypothetical protein